MIKSKKNSKIGINSKVFVILTGILLMGGGIALSVNATNQQSNNGGNTMKFENINNKNLEDSFSTVHFSINGNDFGGGFFWNETKILATPQTIKDHAQREMICNGQIRGYYYNSQRGERLWPLDEDSKTELALIHRTYNKVSIKGGFYTNCNYKDSSIQTGAGHLHAIYGMVTHEYDGKNYKLYAGLANDIQNNSIITPNFSCNLQRIDNQYPFGYIYDGNGGIALVGAYIKPEVMKTEAIKAFEFHKNFTKKLTTTKCVNDSYEIDENNAKPKIVKDEQGSTLDNTDNVLIFGIGNAINTMMNLGIRGIIGLSTQIQQTDQQTIQNNTTKTSLLVATQSNISNIINTSKKRAETLCRNKWTSAYDPKKTINCIQGGENVTITLSNYGGKTVILKQGNIKLTNHMTFQQSPVNILLINGDLYLPSTGTNEYQNFKPNGYPAGINSINPIKGNYLKGNFIINGLIQSQASNGEIQPKLIIHGKIASFNTLNQAAATTKQSTINLINNTRNSLNHLKGDTKLGLSEIFTRKCNLKEGRDIDNLPCSKIDNTQNSKSNANFILDKAFSLIDIYYPSPLFK